MVRLESSAISGCHECVAMLTLPLALFLLLSETAIGGTATVAYLRLRGGLTQGFLKFIAVTYTLISLLAFLVVWAGPPASYQQLLSINQPAAATLVFVQGLLVVALALQVFLSWRTIARPVVAWIPAVLMSLALLITIALVLAPLAGSLLGGVAVALTVLVSTAVLGAATTGMLLGHWYLVTPALTNRPLLRAIVILLIGLLFQAVLFPLALGALGHPASSPARALQLSPVLSVLWALGAVVLPLMATALAFPTCRIRSFMSTTGLLYLAMIALLPGQLLGQLLFFVAAAA
jgi:hypothetical protein